MSVYVMLKVGVEKVPKLHYDYTSVYTPFRLLTPHLYSENRVYKGIKVFSYF